MFTIRKVLVPVDFRHNEKRVIEYAHMLTGNTSARMYLLHVEAPEGPSGASEAEKEEMEGQPEMQLAQLISEARQLGVECDGWTVKGDVSKCILDTANEQDVDCIIMATSGKSAVDRTLVDSVYNHLVKVSPYAVIGVNKRSGLLNDEARAAKIPTTIVCPIDESEFSLSALPIAVDLARFFESRLVVLNVSKYPEEADQAEEEARKRVQGALDGGPTIDFKCETVGKGESTKMLLRAIENAHADLVVVATHGRSRLTQVIWPSAAESMTSFVSCPIMTLRPELMSEVESETTA